jgi:hypothetical protein
MSKTASEEKNSSYFAQGRLQAVKVGDGEEEALRM